MKNKIDVTDVYEERLQYKTTGGRKELILYSKDPYDIAECINYNARVLAKRNAEEELDKLILQKIKQFLTKE